ncbi:MAG: hypothetical protein JSR27_09370 [Proteobacteria bacterium]|nr:hypothetical protein [Pseudomonadota bacterium]
MPNHNRREGLYVPFESLTPKEQERCRQINLRLREIEAWAHARALTVAPGLRARIEDADDPILHFLTKLVLNFQLREDDPDFCKDPGCSNFLAEQRHWIGSYEIPHVREAKSETGDLGHHLCDLEQHWCDDRDPPLLADEAPHCRTFYELRSECYLSWRDVARIGRIFTTFEISEEFWPAIEVGMAERLIRGKEDVPAKFTMNGYLQRELFARYPKLFPPAEWVAGLDSSSRGIACGDGWYNVIDRLCASLQKDIDISGEPQAVAVQVREKGGGLLFYVRPCTQRQRGMIDLAQAMAKRICEICGAPGREYSKEGDYIYRFCEKHRIEHQAANP